MKTSVALAVSLVAVIAAVILVKNGNISNFSNRENFEAAGLVYNRPPEWFHKAAYNPNDWIVAYYPQQISQPACMYNRRGDPRELNYLSSAYRFWRM